MNRRGQSIIEYSLIAVLVIFGVVIMGPYVLRSVGSHFKIWDDGIGDSFQEHLTQAPVGDVPSINSVCNCWYVNAGCGSATAGSQCKPTESILNLTCSLNSVQGCDVGAPLSMCQPDPVNCCTAWTNIRCGSIPTGQTPLPSNDCYIGYELQGHQCGNTATTQCVLASSIGLTCAAATCTGTISTINTASGPVNTATPCTNEPPVSTPLTVTNAISYVQADTQTDCGSALPCTFCDPAQTCQVYCLPGYVLDTSSNPPTQCIPSNSCGTQSICPSSYKVTTFNSYWNNGSTPGQCSSCSTFMCMYSIWVAPSNDSDLFVNQLTTYTRAITLPPGSYSVRFASDDTGSVSIDGAVVCSNTNPGLFTFQNPQNCPFTISASGPNSHTITLKDTNLSGNNSTWCWNPAGVAVEVFNSSGVEVSDGNGPIDTSAGEAGKWTSTVACPTGQCWDCASQKCKTPAGPSTFQCFQNNCVGMQNPGSSCYTPFTQEWNGYYDVNQHSGTQGDEYISVSCNSSGNVGGVCFTPPNQTSEPPNTGGNCSASSNTISCSQSAWFYGQSGSNTTSFRYGLNCANGSLVSIIDNDPAVVSQGITAASTNGCNWSGTIDVMTLQAGNDMYLTCDTSSGQGVLTQFVYAPNG